MKTSRRGFLGWLAAGTALVCLSPRLQLPLRRTAKRKRKRPEGKPEHYFLHTMDLEKIEAWEVPYWPDRPMTVIGAFKPDGTGKLFSPIHLMPGDTLHVTFDAARLS